jgi:hypothetical protein
VKAIVHVQDAINITRIRRTHVNKGLKEQSYDLYISDTKGMGKCYINGPDGSRREIDGGWPVGAIGCLTTHTANYGNRKKVKRQTKLPPK